jgi:rare lipoprotein A
MSKKKLFINLLVGAAVTRFLLPVPADARGRWVTATVYHEWYANRATYCDTTYRHWGISAAHPWLPCGTRVRVSHKGRSLVVPIKDRCECDLDLSAGAASKLGVPIDGIAQVQIQEL